MPASASFDAPYNPTFPDVPTSNAFFVPVEWLVSIGVTTGYDDGNFKPTVPVTRQTLSAFLYRYVEGAGPAPDCTSAPFPDVPTDNLFCGEISWAKTEGLISGYPDGTFRPTEPGQRQSLAVFMYRLKGSPDGPNPSCSSAPFTDVPADHFFCGEIKWAADNDIVAGFPGNVFKPTTVVSRQTFAAMLYNYDLAFGSSAAVSALGAEDAAAAAAAGAAGAAATTSGTGGGSDTPPTGGATETAAPTEVATGGSNGVSLPVTGGNVGSVAILGILLMGGGALLVVGTRRRRQDLNPSA